jgi:glycosyltransferase involved in cell wall biosynthesis
VSPTLSLIIPAYNEAARLEAGFRRLEPVLASLGDIEIIFVDDGSTDGTLQEAGRLYGHLPSTFFIGQERNYGKGAAVRLGLAAARGQVCVISDADHAIHPSHLPAMVRELANYDVVLGARDVNGHIRYDSALRTNAGRLFNRVVRHYTGTTVLDTQCGFKGWQRGPGRLLGLLGLVNRFAFDAEMLYLADALELSVGRLDVTWDDVGGSSVRLGRDSLSMIRDIRRLRHQSYELPVVRCDRGVDRDSVGSLAREARVNGLVIARGDTDDIVAVPRDGALGALGIAAATSGHFGTATLSDFVGRRFEAV